MPTTAQLMPANTTAALGLGDDSATAVIGLLPAERDAGVGLSTGTVEYLSDCKGEPAWLRTQRLDALRAFAARDHAPRWAPPPLAEIPFAALRYYSAPARARRRFGGGGSAATTRVLETLGVAREVREFLGGAQAQIDGEVVYGNLHETWARAGVIFVDSTRGLTEYGDLFRPHFGSVIGRDENRFTHRPHYTTSILTKRRASSNPPEVRFWGGSARVRAAGICGSRVGSVAGDG